MSLTKNEKIEANKVELEITIGAAEFQKALSEVAKKEGRNFTVPGFRKGKAPRSIIETMYGKTVFYTDAVDKLFPDEYRAAITEAKIEPVDQPDVEITAADPETGVTLKAVVTVKPEVKLGNYKGLTAEKAANTVDEAKVNAEIERMADRNSRMVTKEGKAEKGDTANINFEGFLDGTPFEGGKGENFDLLLGSGQFIPGFEEQVVGHVAGDEFDVNVTFPEEYQAKELAGKATVFKCKLNDVKYKEMPAMDDEFAKDVSEYDTLEELKNSIRKEQADAAEKSANLEVENALIDQVVAGMEADIPQCMISQRTDEMVREFSYRMESQGLKLNDYLKYTNNTMDKFRADFTEQAEKQVKIRLALEKIAELEKIEITEDDMNAEIKRIADAYKMEEDKVREIAPLDEVKKDLAVNKAIDFVRSNAKITEKKEKATKAAKSEKTEKAEKTAKPATKKAAKKPADNDK